MSTQPSAALPPLRINHINLVVANVERSARFYEQVLGMERLWEVGDFVFLRCGDSDLALVGGTPTAHRRFHFGFRLENREQVDAWLGRVQELEVEVSHGPADYNDYYTFTCRDPDGYGIEIYWEAEPAGRTGFPESSDDR